MAMPCSRRFVSFLQTFPRSLLQQRRYFNIFVEALPVATTGGSRFFETCEKLLKTEIVDGLSFPASPKGVPKPDPAIIAAFLLGKGVVPKGKLIYPTITARDQTRLSLESKLRGLEHVGLKSVLLLRGDNPTGIVSGAAASPSVMRNSDSMSFQMSTVEMVALATSHFKKHKPSFPREIEDSQHVASIAVAVNPFNAEMDEVERTIEKIIAGADTLFTQPVVVQSSELKMQMAARLRSFHVELEERGWRKSVKLIAGIPIFDNAKGADIVGSLISSFRHDAAEVLVGELEKKTENEWKAMLLEEIRHLRELLPIADGILLYDLTTSRRLLAKPEFLKALSSLKSV